MRKERPLFVAMQVVVQLPNNNMCKLIDHGRLLFLGQVTDVAVLEGQVEEGIRTTSKRFACLLILFNIESLKLSFPKNLGTKSLVRAFP